ncbi:DEAD/DEAH box helicase family protein [Bacillus luteolus]|uniref:DEAD/DEAH box helicase family protein n=1 Tax=Litchfieldia luteola TaxID=682179 RepID=A0ABR9QDA8_9BACI|nr:SNF2-related protein [Cytobacillus luteolus]MBE4906471.1 DEAD/DEAH box helicase family protein [Cytobacillus luteolus]MBP1941154.1 SNF2 family DNA or RNA helicase [Cytobacillus luteolus]
MFKQLALKPSYYTTDGDTVVSFYNPVLSNSVKYDRVSGYFSSKALASYAKGLSGLTKNGGHFRLIISQDISEEDFDLIKKGYDLRNEIKEELFSKLEDYLTLNEEVNFYNLAHLIGKGVVDIKIGFKANGLFHSKFGLCTDKQGNVIYFTGSNNETYAAITHNYEAFDITTSWLASEFDVQKLEKAQKEFELLWNDKAQEKNIFIKEINEVVKKKIMTYDKGRIIVDADMLTKDSLILTIEDNQLVLQDNLDTYRINPDDFALARKLKQYYKSGYPYFRSDLTYIDMQKVITILEKYASKKKFKFIVSGRLIEYIEQHSYWIEERSQYGLLIKNLDSRVITDYKKFQTIVSKELERTLREQQMWSSFYMTQMQKAANFSVPGAGKTSMVYGTFAYLNSAAVNKADKIVMIGPKNSFLSWKLEFEENFGNKKELRVLDIHDEEAAEVHLRLNGSNMNLILINYESLGKYEYALSDIIDEKTVLVFDEVHKIKGVQSIRAQVAKRISEKPIYKFVLTGTPIPNSYQDIYNFLNILYMEEYKMFFNFQLNELKNPSPIEAKEINEKLYPFFWRTNKKQLEVPMANEDMIIKCTMTHEEQKIIDLLYRKYGNSPFNLYIRLIQASANPELLLKTIDFIEMYGDEYVEDWDDEFQTDTVSFNEEEIKIIRKVTESTKFYRALQLVEQLHQQNKQSIVWCMFVNTIDKVYRELCSKGIKAAVIYGSTPQKDRDKIIDMFKKTEIEVLITNPHTLAESVSLHKTCHDAIYLEYSFNLTHMLQSRDRIHRLGLPEGQYTQYYYFMLENEDEHQRNTIDEKIYVRLKEKEGRMIEAIEGDILTPEPSDDMDEILKLFEL